MHHNQTVIDIKQTLKAHQLLERFDLNLTRLNESGLYAGQLPRPEGRGLKKPS